MAHEKLTKRTVWIAKCPSCEFTDVKADNPPREILCINCQTWCKYTEQSWIGQDKFTK